MALGGAPESSLSGDCREAQAAAPLASGWAGQATLHELARLHQPRLTLRTGAEARPTLPWRSELVAPPAVVLTCAALGTLPPLSELL